MRLVPVVGGVRVLYGSTWKSATDQNDASISGSNTGSGYAIARVTPLGSVRLAGVSGDGQPFTAASFVSTDGIVPIHQGLQNALNGSTDRPTQFRKNAMLATQFNKAIERACEINHALSTYAMDPSILPRAD